jgi:hypothetical protein
MIPNWLTKAIKENELSWQGRKVGSGKMDTKVFVQKGFVPFVDADTDFNDH